MKVYTEFGKEASSAEVGMSNAELEELISMLCKFKAKIDQYKKDHPTDGNLGYAHIHFQDHAATWKKGDADLVFYVPLNS